MTKLTLTDIAAGYALITTFNANNALIVTALENTLSRDGTTPNTMSAALDMNSQQINNLTTPAGDSSAVRKDYVDDLVAAITAASGTFSVADAHNFTNQIDFLGSIRILDALGTDALTMDHNGTDSTFVWNATDKVDFSGVTTEYTFDNTIRFVGANNKGIISENVDGLSAFAFASTGTYSSISSGGSTPLPILIDANGQYLRLDVNGVFIEETSAAAADITARGQIWIKDDTPNTLNFTNDAGEDEVISSVDGSFTPTWTGFSVDPAAVVRYSIKGNLVTVMIDVSTALGTSNATSFQMANVPAAIQPATTQHCFIAGAVDNNSNINGMTVEVQAATAAWLLTTTAARGTWTASSNKGFAEAEGYCFSYFLTDPS